LKREFPRLAAYEELSASGSAWARLVTRPGRARSAARRTESGLTKPSGGPGFCRKSCKAS